MFFFTSNGNLETICSEANRWRWANRRETEHAIFARHFDHFFHNFISVCLLTSRVSDVLRIKFDSVKDTFKEASGVLWFKSVEEEEILHS